MATVLTVVFVILGSLAAWLIYAMKDDPETLDDDSTPANESGWLGGVTDHDLRKYEDPSYLEHHHGDDDKFDMA